MYSNTFAYSLPPSDATISILSADSPIPEGGSTEVCVELSDIPSFGLECDVEVVLEIVNVAKAGQLF